MIVVLFEVTMNEGRTPDYFALAQRLREELVKIDGFISVERFQSLNDPAKYLSLSTWRDEAAVSAWYAQLDHRQAQGAGRGGIFADYRIRVASVFRDYDMAQGRPRIAPEASR